ncbi:MAG: hypothetical protein CMQ75_02155 [Gammaproteobacteria bacterium]|nr:hypothetical protein [Gammaproteobacteria bacterium]
MLIIGVLFKAMNRSSIFKRKIDFKKSHGSYLVDKDNEKKYLDFFGQYSTLTIGYNHKIFSSSEYIEDIKRVAHQKITNCEILSDESSEFDRLFRKYTSNGYFSHYHYSCTGALAIEAAIKTAMDYKGKGHHSVITFKGSFHGINSYGGFLTCRFQPVKNRLSGFPKIMERPFDNPVIKYQDGKKIVDSNFVSEVLTKVEHRIKSNDNVCAILVEPIQCTYGDYYFPDEFFIGIREIATKYDIPLIFDEIQIGFGGTGKIWYHEHLSIVPDILVFGKKTQLSGIAVQEQFSKIFKTSIRLEVTWDADIVDMIRCKYIMKVLKSESILQNVNKMANRLKSGLEKIKKLKNLRNKGLLFAFDFSDKHKRDIFFNGLINNQILSNPTREKTVRLRPHLCVSKDEIDHAVEIIKTVSKKI